MFVLLSTLAASFVVLSFVGYLEVFVGVIVLFCFC